MFSIALIARLVEKLLSEDLHRLVLKFWFLRLLTLREFIQLALLKIDDEQHIVEKVGKPVAQTHFRVLHIFELYLIFVRFSHAIFEFLDQLEQIVL